MKQKAASEETASPALSIALPMAMRFQFPLLRKIITMKMRPRRDFCLVKWWAAHDTFFALIS